MKTMKLTIVSLLLSLCVNGLFANTKPSIVKSETEQIKTYLEKMEFNKVITGNKDISIQFTINDRNEIIISSTSDTDLDAMIKAGLNYKPIQLSTLERNATYTIPVHVVLQK
jgi:hypothetical protein